VDIDAQAVETTKLSLLLKVLEGENEQTISRQLRMFHERALPDLGSNIKCGNSLIGPDFYDGQLSLMDDTERMRINVFDWKKEFKDIMDAGGFDVVIGNPPYIRIQAMKEWAPVEVEFYKERYHSASSGNYDIYVVFVEKGLSLLIKNGLLGFILPHKFFNADYGEELRRLIADGGNLSQVVHFGDQQIFADATTYTCLLFLGSERRKGFELLRVNDLLAWQVGGQSEKADVLMSTLSSTSWNFTTGNKGKVFERLRKSCKSLGSVARIFQGLVTGADKVFVLERKTAQRGGLEKVRDLSGKDWTIESGILRPFVNDVSLASYEAPSSDHWILFPYKLQGSKAELFELEELADRFPFAFDYFKRNSSALRARERGKWDHERWYALGRTQNLTQMEGPKLIVQVISQSGRYAYDNNDLYFTGGGNGPYYGVRWLPDGNLHSLHYLQGLLNSRLLDWYHHQISTTFRGGYWSYGKRFIEQLPIRTINFSDPGDKARHDKMVGLVEQMLELHKKLAAAKLDHEKNTHQRQIAATDKQIDELVYELYDLTDQERKVIEKEG